MQISTPLQGQAVRLDDDGHVRRLQVGHRRVIIGEGLVGSRGDAVLLHQVFGEDLAALDDGRGLAGTEGGDAHLRQRVHHAQAQRIVGRNDDEVDRVVLRPGGDARHIGGLVGQALADGRHAAVAGGRVKLGDLRILRDFQGDGVLTATAANDKNVHNEPP